MHSLGGHFSAGIHSSASSSFVNNIDLQARVAPAVEWDLFPYADFQRRRLLLSYSAEANRLDYTSLTVYDKLTEELLDHKAAFTLALWQPWGVSDLGVSASAFLPDQQKN